MNRRGEGGGVYVFGVIVVLLLAALVYFLFFKESEALSVGSEGETLIETVFVRTSLSNLYHSQLDPLMPAYLSTRESDCDLAGGDWIDSRNRVGCFDVPAWDSTACTGGEISFLKNVCNGIEETVWVCDAHNVGCYYE